MQSILFLTVSLFKQIQITQNGKEFVIWLKNASQLFMKRSNYRIFYFFVQFSMDSFGGFI